MFAETDDLETVITTLKQFAKTFAITQGPKGAIIFDGKNIFDIPAKEVKVIDTVGAGDMFAGGFLYAITHGHDFKTAGIIGDIVASKVITKFGPKLAMDEIESVKKEIEQL